MGACKSIKINIPLITIYLFFSNKENNMFGCKPLFLIKMWDFCAFGSCWGGAFLENTHNIATLANRLEAKALCFVETLRTDYPLKQCHVPKEWKPQILIYKENFTVFRHSIGLWLLIDSCTLFALLFKPQCYIKFFIHDTHIFSLNIHRKIIPLLHVSASRHLKYSILQN